MTQGHLTNEEPSLRTLLNLIRLERETFESRYSDFPPLSVTWKQHSVADSPNHGVPFPVRVLSFWRR